MNDLRKLEEEIKSKEAELASILPQFQSHKGKEERLSARLKACEQHRLELFAKEGRSLKFSSAEDRDTWLNREIMSLQQSAAQKEKQVREERESLGLCFTYVSIFLSLDSRLQASNISLKI